MDVIKDKQFLTVLNKLEKILDIKITEKKELKKILNNEKEHKQLLEKKI
jgi:hypothetical protein